MFTANPKWITVLIWLLCTTVLAAFLDNCPDPPSTKPSLVAAASIRHVLVNAAPSPWTNEQRTGAVLANPPHWLTFETVVMAKQSFVKTAPAQDQTSGLSPPSAG